MKEQPHSNNHEDHKNNGTTVVETSVPVHVVEPREEEKESMVVSLSSPSFSPSIHDHGDEGDTRTAHPTSAAKEDGSDDDEESSNFSNQQKILTDISQLPALPTPADTKHVQAAGGTCLVVSSVIIVFGVSQSILLSYKSLSDPIIQAFVSLGVMESIWVLASLVGLLLCDPGTVKRTPDTCFPIPSEVANVLHNHNSDPHNNTHTITNPNTRSHNEGVQQEENSTKESVVHNKRLVQHNIVTLNGDTYCVRCFVWRRQDPSSSKTIRYHHCSICQRCYHDFDHHCSVFGRCIAGTIRRKSRRGLQLGRNLPQGNLIYFASLIVSGIVGGVTALVGITLTIAFEYGGWTVVVVLVSCYILFTCLFGYRCNLFHKLQRCGRQCWIQIRKKKRKNWNRQVPSGVPLPPLSSSSSSSSLPRYELAPSCDDPTTNDGEAEAIALPVQEMLQNSSMTE